MNYSLLAVYTMTIALLIATPGPVVALVLTVSATRGFRPALLTVLGTNWASLLLIGAATLIISGVLSVNDALLTWLSLFGCFILLWYAVSALRAKSSREDQDDKQQATALSLGKDRPISTILHGFIVGISNPKDIIFFVAFFPQFVGITSRYQVSLVVLSVIWIGFDFLILLGYATMLKSAFFQQRKHFVAKLSAAFLLIVASGGLIYTVRELLPDT